MIARGAIYEGMMMNTTAVDRIADKELLYAIGMTVEGFAVLTWRSDEGVEHAELDPNSADVKEALALIRRVIWG
jgi:hypothetical protein